MFNSSSFVSVLKSIRKPSGVLSNLYFVLIILVQFKSIIGKPTMIEPRVHLEYIVPKSTTGTLHHSSPIRNNVEVESRLNNRENKLELTDRNSYMNKATTSNRKKRQISSITNPFSLPSNGQNSNINGKNRSILGNLENRLTSLIPSTEEANSTALNIKYNSIDNHTNDGLQEVPPVIPTKKSVGNRPGVNSTFDPLGHYEYVSERNDLELLYKTNQKGLVESPSKENISVMNQNANQKLNYTHANSKKQENSTMGESNSGIHDIGEVLAGNSSTGLSSNSQQKNTNYNNSSLENKLKKNNTSASNRPELSSFISNKDKTQITAASNNETINEKIEEEIGSNFSIGKNSGRDEENSTIKNAVIKASMNQTFEENSRINGTSGNEVLNKDKLKNTDNKYDGKNGVRDKLSSTDSNKSSIMASKNETIEGNSRVNGTRSNEFSNGNKSKMTDNKSDGIDGAQDETISTDSNKNSIRKASKNETLKGNTSINGTNGIEVSNGNKSKMSDSTYDGKDGTQDRKIRTDSNKSSIMRASINETLEQKLKTNGTRGTEISNRNKSRNTDSTNDQTDLNTQGNKNNTTIAKTLNNITVPNANNFEFGKHINNKTIERGVGKNKSTEYLPTNKNRDPSFRERNLSINEPLGGKGGPIKNSEILSVKYPQLNSNSSDQNQADTGSVTATNGTLSHSSNSAPLSALNILGRKSNNSVYTKDGKIRDLSILDSLKKSAIINPNITSPATKTSNNDSALLSDAKAFNRSGVSIHAVTSSPYSSTSAGGVHTLINLSNTSFNEKAPPINPETNSTIESTFDNAGSLSATKGLSNDIINSSVDSKELGNKMKQNTAQRQPSSGNAIENTITMNGENTLQNTRPKVDNKIVNSDVTSFNGGSTEGVHTGDTSVGRIESKHEAAMNILSSNQTNDASRSDNQVINNSGPLNGRYSPEKVGAGPENKNNILNIPYTNDISEENEDIPNTKDVNFDDKIYDDDHIIVLTETTEADSITEKITNVVLEPNYTPKTMIIGTRSFSTGTPYTELKNDYEKTTPNPGYPLDEITSNSKTNTEGSEPDLVPTLKEAIKHEATVDNSISEDKTIIPIPTVDQFPTKQYVKTTENSTYDRSETTDTPDSEKNEDCETENSLSGILGTALHYGALGGSAGAIGAMLPQILKILKDIFKKDGDDGKNNEDNENNTGKGDNQTQDKINQDQLENTISQPEENTQDFLEKKLTEAEDEVLNKINDKIDDIEGSVMDTIKGKLTDVEDGIICDLKEQILHGDGNILQNASSLFKGENNLLKNVKARVINAKDGLIGDIKTSFKSEIENDVSEVMTTDSVGLKKSSENLRDKNRRTNIQMLFLNDEATTRRISWPTTRNDYLGRAVSIESIDEKQMTNMGSKEKISLEIKR